jgi:hypothetical protein
MKIVSANFNAKVECENIFKLTLENKSIHRVSNDNDVKIVNFATSKNLAVKSMMFPQQKHS